jgi:hypothetical protein
VSGGEQALTALDQKGLLAKEDATEGGHGEVVLGPEGGGSAGERRVNMGF